jgi:hypothetical protein
MEHSIHWPWKQKEMSVNTLKLLQHLQQKYNNIHHFCAYI